MACDFKIEINGAFMLNENYLRLIENGIRGQKELFVTFKRVV